MKKRELIGFDTRMNRLNSQIEHVRKRLNILIENNAPYGDIYKVSCSLDKLIVQYHKMALSC